MSYKIEDIEGIGPSHGQRLADAGIKTTGALLKLCCDAKGRESVAEKTGFGTSVLLKWANMADLMRISGVGSEFSELLEAAGVDTVLELRQRNAENLAESMRSVNKEKRLTRAAPSAKTVAKWVEQSKQLEPVITH